MVSASNLRAEKNCPWEGNGHDTLEDTAAGNLPLDEFYDHFISTAVCDGDKYRVSRPATTFLMKWMVRSHLKTVQVCTKACNITRFSYRLWLFWKLSEWYINTRRMTSFRPRCGYGALFIVNGHWKKTPGMITGSRGNYDSLVISYNFTVSIWVNVFDFSHFFVTIRKPFSSLEW